MKRGVSQMLYGTEWQNVSEASLSSGGPVLVMSASQVDSVAQCASSSQRAAGNASSVVLSSALGSGSLARTGLVVLDSALDLVRTVGERRVRLLTSGTQVCSKGQVMMQPSHGGMAGFARSVRSENPSMKLGLTSVADWNPVDKLHRLGDLAELCFVAELSLIHI